MQQAKRKPRSYSDYLSFLKGRLLKLDCHAVSPCDICIRLPHVTEGRHCLQHSVCRTYFFFFFFFFLKPFVVPGSLKQNKKMNCFCTCVPMGWVLIALTDNTNLYQKQICHMTPRGIFCLPPFPHPIQLCVCVYVWNECMKGWMNIMCSWLCVVVIKSCHFRRGDRPSEKRASWLCLLAAGL